MAEVSTWAHSSYTVFYCANCVFNCLIEGDIRRLLSGAKETLGNVIHVLERQGN